MATTVQRLTYDDLSSIPREQISDRHELIDGELVVTPAPAPNHQDISDNLTYLLNRHVRPRNLGKIYAAPIDVRLNPEMVLGPDIIFISEERRHIVGPKTVDAAPELVVEILSPGTRRRDLEVKRGLYARFGVQEYWIVDPDERSLTILALQGDRFHLVPSGEDKRLISRLFPDLALNRDEIFDNS